MKHLIAGAFVLLAISSLLIAQLWSSSDDHDTEERSGASATATPSTERQPAPRTSSLHREADRRHEVRRVIAQEVGPLGQDGDEARLDAYLDKLEARARAKGEVTALVVEPGIAAIHRLMPRIGPERASGKLAAFDARMRRLSAQLSGRTGSAPAPDLDKLGRAIATEDDVGRRQELIRSFIRATSGLDHQLRHKRLAQLDGLVASAGKRQED